MSSESWGREKTESGGAGVALRQRSELGWMESPGYQGGSERRGVCACNEKWNQPEYVLWRKRKGVCVRDVL